MSLGKSKLKSVLIWQMPGCFAGEDQHRLAHYRLRPMLQALLGEKCPSVRFASGSLQDLHFRFTHEEQPDLLVLPTFREHTWQSLEAVDSLAQVAPDTSIVLSGWGSDPDYLDEIRPRIGHARLFVARGEVEAALLPCIALLIEGVPSVAAMAEIGIAVPGCDGGWANRGRFREAVDLSQVPSPYQTGDLSIGDFGGMVLIEVARGCLFHCQFCLSCNYPTNRPRLFPIASIANDIRYASENRARSIGLLCSGLNYSLELLDGVAEAFRQLPKGAKPFIESTIHASLLDPRRLAAIQTLPWQRMIIGLQTTNPKALTAMGRDSDNRGFRQAMEKVCAFHTPVVELILGLPGDSLEGFVETMRFVLDMPVDIEVYALRLDPGSGFFSDREQLGLRADFTSQGRVLSTPTFSAEHLKRAEWALRQLGKNPWTHRAKRLGFDFECLYEEGISARGAKR